jgi:hypothetical protein
MKRYDFMALNGFSWMATNLQWWALGNTAMGFLVPQEQDNS